MTLMTCHDETMKEKGRLDLLKILFINLGTWDLQKKRENMGGFIQRKKIDLIVR